MDILYQGNTSAHRLQLSRSELCKTWLVSLDFLSLIEYRLLQQVEKSVDKDGNQQSDVYNLIHKKNVETYQNVSSRCGPYL